MGNVLTGGVIIGTFKTSDAFKILGFINLRFTYQINY
jgi:hypothetical protein